MLFLNSQRADGSIPRKGNVGSLVMNVWSSCPRKEIDGPSTGLFLDLHTEKATSVLVV